MICIDKTGTITESAMKLGHIHSNGRLIEQTDFASEKNLLEMGTLATRAHTTLTSEHIRGTNPMSAAIADAASGAGISLEELAKTPLINEFSFDSNTKTASYVYKLNGSLRIYTSGAPE